MIYQTLISSQIAGKAEGKVQAACPGNTSRALSAEVDCHGATSLTTIRLELPPEHLDCNITCTPHPASEMHADVCHRSHRKMNCQQKRQHHRKWTWPPCGPGSPGTFHTASLMVKPKSQTETAAEGVREVVFTFLGTAVAQMQWSTWAGQCIPKEEQPTKGECPRHVQQ